MNKTIDYRKNILLAVKEDLNIKLKNYIVSAVVYGSTLCEDFCDFSDFDILLILNKSEIEILNKIKNIREKYLERNIILDFNVHLETEMPRFRKGAFWHNNRGFYIQKELKTYGINLMGEDLFKNLEPKQKDIKLESIRVVNSLLYQTRKLLINKKINPEDKIKLMKFCIYSVLYSLAAKDIYPNSKIEALKIFSDNFNSSINPKIFFDKKLLGPNFIDEEDIKLVYKFISELDANLFSQYEKGLL